jgi:hypothetical protein
MSERAALVKFGMHEHLAQLREEGLLYMNTLPYFWKLEEQEFRGDTFDGVEKIARGTRGEGFASDGTKFSIGKWFIRIHPPDAEKINIFSMYAMRPDAGSFPVDERNFRFGDSAIVISNPQAFIDRVESLRESQGIACEAKLVEYVPNDHAGDVGPFKKLARFNYQSEWRVVCYEGTGEPRLIRIGSIADFSTIIPSKEINEIVWPVPEPS